MKLCRLTCSETKRPIYINPERIEVVRQDGTKTYIFFCGDDSHATVSEPVEEAIQILLGYPQGEILGE